MASTTVERIAQAGAEKARTAKTDPARYLFRAAAAGAFIFIGALISCLCSAWFYSGSLPLARLLGAASFSAALILVVLLGGELFTGCNLVMGMSLYEGRSSVSDLIRVWAMAYVGNFIGIFILSLLLAGSGASRELLAVYLSTMVPGKLAGSWYTLLLKGALCNFMVCLGVFAGFKLQSECGKALVIALVITTFVLCGLEHSVANMAFFSLHALLNTGADFAGMGWNLLWVTIGNILGGAVLLGFPLWCCAGKKPAG